MRDESATGGLQSVRRALTALELVADAGELGVSELGRQLGVHKATASRLAATLAERGLLERDPVTERYRIGFGLVRLAGAAMSGLDLVRTSRPILEELAERTRESANLGVLSGDGIVYVDQVAGSQAIVTVNWVGRRTPLHATSNGKVLLAFMDDAEQDRYLAAPLDTRTDRTVVDPRGAPRAAGRGAPTRIRADPRGAGGGSQRGRRPGAAGGRPRDRRARRVGAGVPDAGRRPAADRAVDRGGGGRRLATARLPRSAEDGRMTTDWAASREPAGSLLDAIGRTPLVRLARVAPDVELFAKVEWYGPTGSVKDRIYAAMLTPGRGARRAEARHDDHRVHDGQRRDRVLGGRRDQGLPVRHRDARGHEPGAAPDDRRVRGRAGADAGRRHGHRPRAREDARDRRRRPSALLLPGRVREPGQPAGAGALRRGDLGAVRWGGRGRRLAGNGRMDHRRRPSVETSPCRRAGLRRRAGRVPADQRAALGHARRPRDRRRHRGAEPRPGGARRGRRGLDRRVARDGAAARERRGTACAVPPRG